MRAASNVRFQGAVRSMRVVFVDLGNGFYVQTASDVTPTYKPTPDSTDLLAHARTYRTIYNDVDKLNECATLWYAEVSAYASFFVRTMKSQVTKRSGESLAARS